MKVAHSQTKLSAKQRDVLLTTLQARFEKNRSRHDGLEWSKVAAIA